MTKKLSKPCLCCTHYSGGIPCQKGHRPRWYVDGGLRRVCDDFTTQEPKAKMPEYHPWIDKFKAIFGFRRS